MGVLLNITNCVHKLLFSSFYGVFNKGQSNINDVIHAHNTATIQLARWPVF